MDTLPSQSAPPSETNKEFSVWFQRTRERSTPKLSVRIDAQTRRTPAVARTRGLRNICRPRRSATIVPPAAKAVMITMPIAIDALDVLTNTAVMLTSSKKLQKARSN